MNDVHVASFDLNLLVAFDALWSERHVTRAARRVGLTQPAMSHALRRLRARYEDVLFEPTRAGLMPTSRAQAIAPAVKEALALVGRTLKGPAPFDARALRRTFTLATTDYVELVVLPPLLGRIARDAPGVSITVRAIQGGPARALVSGEHDLAIGPDLDPTPGIRTEPLFRERFVCALREGHPAASRRWTLAAFLKLGHVLVSPQGSGEGTVDAALRPLGKTRDVRVRVPHFLVAPRVVAASDFVITLPERVARAVPEGLVFREPPLALTGFLMSQLWHARHDDDPAHAWLRGLIAEVSAEAPKRRTKARPAREERAASPRVSARRGR
jgi:DNA-binding transcriptional LysR family regulator